MKQVKSKFSGRILILFLGMILSIGAFAQSNVKGQVKDASGEPIIGASVLVNGTSNGTMTDLDGNFVVNVRPGTMLTISYIGYLRQQVAAVDGMVVILKEDQAQQMNEVVVIGYGVAKKSDLTGSVLAMKPDAKNKGVVVNAQDMMQGKMAGVNIVSKDGTPGGGATIRIRGGSSLNASNDPLIVIDGVAIDNNGVKGLSNLLSIVNPQDIESFNILKDASATAIYGSRGSNGVIIITTKKGRKGLQISYNGSTTISTKKKLIDVLSADQYREFITKLYGVGSDAYKALGTANTNWQEEIYRTAVSHDHNLTIGGQVGDWLPYRISGGYTGQQGILKTSSFDRFTTALNLSPSLLNKHLNINLNLKGLYAKSRYADAAAVGAAVYMDPTQSVYDNTSPNAFGGYFQWKTSSNYNNPKWGQYEFNNIATRNPVSILDLKNDIAHSREFIGSADLDYQVHGFEDLRLHATLGSDIAFGQQDTQISPYSPQAVYYGSYGWETILKRNFQFSSYAQYFHDFKDRNKNHFDIMAGYEWQHYWRTQKNSYWGIYPDGDPTLDSNGQSMVGQLRNVTNYRYATENYLVSFFGRANWSMKDGRYLLTATVRNDGSSRFREHWALFPSLAFGWRLKDEKMLSKVDWLSDLKLRLGWGKTGQQDGIGDYNYFAIYKNSRGIGSYYPLTGDGSVVRPVAYDPNLKWETTTTTNIGLDWGIIRQRLTGSFDWYYRKTTDLLNTAYVPAGSNFANKVTSNIGSMKNIGFEAQIHWPAVSAKDWNWTLDYNFTYNHNEITDLSGGSDPDYYVPTGDGAGGGTGNKVQAHTVGHAASSFYVYQQVYDANGRPIDGAVVDRNGDGQITPADKYFYKSPAAPVRMGLASRVEYKNWDLGASLRASFGNYVYNNVEAGMSNVSRAAVWLSSGFMSNRTPLAIADNWQTDELPAKLSDRWVHNASYLKCDNITLGYSFSDLFRCSSWNGISGRIYGTASNIFTITKYKGLDPEVENGIDNNAFPRAFSFILGLSLNF